MNEMEKIAHTAHEKLSEFITRISIKGVTNGSESQLENKFKSNYWGFIFSRIQRVPDFFLPSPAGVAPTKDGSLQLIYNPAMIVGMNDKDLFSLMEHEGLHILNKHISRGLRIYNQELDKKRGEEKIKLFFRASDFAVNSQANIEYLTVHGVKLHGERPELYGLPLNKISEWYYIQLLKQQEEQKKQKQNNKEKEDSSDQSDNKDESTDKKENEKDKKDKSKKKSKKSPDKNDDKDKKENEENKNQNGNGNGDGEKQPEDLSGVPKPDANIDSHEQWTNEVSKEIENIDILPKKIDDFTQSLVRESKVILKNAQKNRGSIPGYMQELIDDILGPPKIPYYQIIRNLVRGSRISKFRSSSTTINRKRSYVFLINDKKVPMISPFPGKKRDFTFSIGILIDTSGSMSVEEMHEGLVSVKDLIENDKDVDVTVIENDTKIQKEYKVKKLEDIDPKMKGRGGTTLFPGLNRIRELKKDVCLCFTDGEIENINSIDRNLLPKRIIWVMPEGSPVDRVNKSGFVVLYPKKDR